MSRRTSLGFAFLVLIAPAILHAQVALPPLPPTPVAPVVPAAPAAVPVTVPITASNPNALKWDAEAKDFDAKAGEISAAFTFVVTNISKEVVSINSLRTSCGCTVAQLPSTPYQLGAGSNVSIGVTMDLRGKFGQVTKSVSVDSSVGFKSLLVKANIPQATAAANGASPNVMGDRAKNIQNALADRQAIFKGDCAKCHVEPGVGKMGAELYTASCGICHDAEHRAAMVPDLKSPRSARDLAFWQKWIMEGKPGTLMPGFAAAHGGPLTQEQVDSLTVYLFQTFPKGPQSFGLPSPVPVGTQLKK